MFEVSLGASGVNYSVERADELFERNRQEVLLSTDRLFARLMFVQWLIGILLALFVTPLTWIGQASQVDTHIWVAIYFGGAISIIPICLTRIWPGAPITRYVIAVAQMIMSALLIALTGGRIETHFHIFGSLAILSLYRDWRVFVPATVFVALDHFLRGLYWPYSLYGVGEASLLQSVEHVGWVIFEVVFLIILCRRSIKATRSIANWSAALEASEQGFSQIFDEAPIGMAVVGLDESFTQVNATLCEMVGYSKSELTQLTTMDITFEEDIPQAREDAEELLTGGPRSSVEKRYIHKNGEILWITRTACLMRDVDGQPRAFLVMVEDISERKRAERELFDSKRELEAAHHANQLIMDHSQDVICTMDEWGRFVSVSPACEQMWGYTPAELIGRSHMDLVCPEDSVMTSQVGEILRLDGKITDFVNRYTRKDGTLIDVLWSATWSETAKIMFCVAHDVTDRARMEKALREAKEEADRANHAKSEFLSRMSHELRTPLNAILGFSQLIERNDPTDAQRNRVDHILSAGRDLLNLTNEVLDISRLEAGDLKLSLESVRVVNTLDEVRTLICPLAEKRRIELSIVEPMDQGVCVIADRQRFKQVLLTLLTTAVKSAPLDGKITLSPSTTQSGKMRIVVGDPGAAISAEVQPLDRLGAEQVTVEETGLGFTLCQRLMQAMNGTIGVSPTRGYGSIFWVELACAETLPVHKASAKRNGSHPGSNGTGRTILYIEDNVSNITLVEQILAAKPDIELITAMRGQLGLELARERSPDLILLDLHLPDLPGWEVIARLQRDEATREIPVVVISADVTSRQIKRLMAAGASAYLTKPFDMPEFFRIIEHTSARRIREACAV